MNTLNLAVYKFCLPLTRPLVIGGEELTQRTGFYLCLNDSAGHQGISEISPLPGLHRENLDDVLQELKKIHKQVKTWADFDFTNFSIFEPFNGSGINSQLSPSTRFGLEMALLDLVANIKSLAVCSLLNPNHNRSIPVNALLTSKTCQEVEQESSNLKKRGCETVKIKIGRETVENDINRVRVARQSLGDKVVLRLDANRCLSLEHAVVLGNGVFDCNIEFIEEPTADVAQNIIFYQETGVKFALDESLILKSGKIESLITELVGTKSLAAFVLKPSILGSLKKTRDWTDLAGKMGIYPVITSCFETPVGLETLANLAMAIIPPGVACGLGTADWFNDSSYSSEIFNCENYLVNFDDLLKNRRKKVDFSALQQISLN